MHQKESNSCKFSTILKYLLYSSHVKILHKSKGYCMKLAEKWDKGKVLNRWEWPEQTQQNTTEFINALWDHFLVLQHLTSGSHITNAFSPDHFEFSCGSNWFSFSSSTNLSELWNRICFLFWLKPKIKWKKGYYLVSSIAPLFTHPLFWNQTFQYMHILKWTKWEGTSLLITLL